MADLADLRDHWWWRPGWRIGRSFYTWHITFTDQPAITRLANDYAAALADLPVYDPIPIRWLHLTLQGIGFTDEIARHDVDQIVERARDHCAQLAPFTITIGPAEIDPEALALPVEPVAELAAVRVAIREAIGDVLGSDQVPEQAEGFRPHVSLGYTNAAGPAAAPIEALARHAERRAEITVDSVSLIDLNRDEKMYQWTDVARVQLGY